MNNRTSSSWHNYKMEVFSVVKNINSYKEITTKRYVCLNLIDLPTFCSFSYPEIIHKAGLDVPGFHAVAEVLVG